MSRLSLWVLLLAAASVGASPAAKEIGGEASWPSAKAAPDAAPRDGAFPEADVALLVFDALDPARVEAVKRANAAPGRKALQIGLDRAAGEALHAAPALHWRALGDGSHVTRLQAHAAGAKALRAALQFDEWPAGAELRVFGADAGRAEWVADSAEVARQLATTPTYWTAVAEGDTLTVELWLPPGHAPRWTQPRLQAIAHLFVSPSGSLKGAKIDESDDCEIDARCVASPSAAYNNARQSVARMTFQTGGSTGLCTGTLLNDTDNASQIPHFFGAAHCFTSQSIANTLTTHWLFEKTATVSGNTCQVGGVDTSASQVGGGAQIQFANTGSDVLLLRLNGTPPASAYYLGWNSGALSNNAPILVLHHPAGDVKKVSLGNVKGFGPSNLASGQFTQAGYTNGTTEGGSSGCALLTNNGSEYQLRGGLLGGGASCANTGSLSNPNNYDDFSRFDLVFPQLQAFLAPSGGNPNPSADYTGAWNNSSQSGWGLVVIRGSSGVYAMYIYHYDADSTPGWYLSAASLNGSTFNAGVLAFSGPWFGINPFNPAAVSNRTAGNLTVTFTSATTATINFTIDGRNVSTTLNKLAF